MENKIINNLDLSLKESKIDEIAFSKTSVKIRFEQTTIASHLDSKGINSFQLSTGIAEKEFPGKTPIKVINEKNIKNCLSQEKAIQIITSDNKLNGTPNPDSLYYIIGVLGNTKEFHFVRLFIEGWFYKPSKSNKGSFIEKNKLPSSALEKLLLKKSGEKSYTFFGFYLFPINDNSVNVLLG